MPKTTAWLICLEVEWKQALPYYQGSRWSLNWQGKKTKTFNVHQTPFPPNLTSHSGDTARSPSPLWGYSMHNVRPALNQLSIFGVHLPLALVVFGLCHLVRQTRKRGLATRCNLGEPCLSLADNLFVCCARFAIIPHSIPVPLSLLSNVVGGFLCWLGCPCLRGSVVHRGGIGWVFWAAYRYLAIFVQFAPFSNISPTCVQMFCNLFGILLLLDILPPFSG